MANLLKIITKKMVNIKTAFLPKFGGGVGVWVGVGVSTISTI